MPTTCVTFSRARFHIWKYPLRSIINFAQEKQTDLIVMSSHSRSGIRQMLSVLSLIKMLSSAARSTSVILDQESLHKEGFIRMKEV